MSETAEPINWRKRAREITPPDYNHSILSVANSILAYYGAPHLYNTLPVLDKALTMHSYKNVVLLILDGLGVEFMRRSMEENVFLKRYMVDTISSVFPPTTAAATNTLYSGLPPISHGWLGWSSYFKEYDKVVELFRNTEFYSQTPLQTPPVSQQLKYERLGEQITKATQGRVTTSEVFPGFIRKGGAYNFAELCQKIKDKTMQEGEQFVLSYWPEPDHTSHVWGPYSRQVRHKIKKMNRHLRFFSRKLKDTLIIVTADHGHTPVRETFWVNNYPDFEACLDKPLSLEERASVVFVKDGCTEKFKELFQKYFSHKFMLLSREEVLQKKLFGTGEMHPRALDFLGDFLIVSLDGTLLSQYVNGMSPWEKLRGAHAGMSRAEMEVPLVLIERP